MGLATVPFWVRLKVRAPEGALVTVISGGSLKVCVVVGTLSPDHLESAVRATEGAK